MLVDSNIIIYAINADSPKHNKAQKFLQDNIGALEITHQNILESARVLTHPKFPKPMKIKKALKAIQAITEACRIVYPSQTAYYLAIGLISKHQLAGNRIFDAYLAATALSSGISTIATDNTADFEKFKGLKVVNPFG